MEDRSSKRLRTLVTQWPVRGLAADESAGALISMRTALAKPAVNRWSAGPDRPDAPSRTSRFCWWPASSPSHFAVAICNSMFYAIHHSKVQGRADGNFENTTSDPRNHTPHPPQRPESSPTHSRVEPGGAGAHSRCRPCNCVPSGAGRDVATVGLRHAGHRS